MSIRPELGQRRPGRAARLGAVDVPGDFSSAAPFIVAATLVPESRITIHDVSLNPRRTGLLDVLERMGARVGILTRRRSGAEPVGDLEIRAGELTATTIRTEEVPLLVDELPLFGLLAARLARRELGLRRRASCGTRRPTGSRRVVDALRAIGARAPRRTRTASRSPACRPGRAAAGSTRAATTGSRCWAPWPASWSRDGVEIEGAESAAISFPGFYDLLDRIVQR